jgi:hypothetical protein
MLTLHGRGRGPCLSFPVMPSTRALLVSAIALIMIACGGSSAETSANTPAPASTVTPRVSGSPSPSSSDLVSAVPPATSTPTPTSASTRASLRGRHSSPAASPSTQAPAGQGAPGQPGDQYAPLRSQGVSAVCNDGSYSHSKHRQGTCSHHQGVKAWTGLI